VNCEWRNFNILLHEGLANGLVVIGTDLSPIQPGWVPPNLQCEIDDATQTWTWADNTIDFVHPRIILGGIGDWVDFFRNGLRVLKPGGYFESFEISTVIKSDDGSIAPGK
jgi:hypothetical protein